ncbi:MAG: succinate dehydrogenase cytochrome b subunit [Candidatus Margulisiibacteriota bacterium]
MTGLRAYVASSIGKKQIVAISGLLLVGYLVFHLSMNLLFFAGPDAFNFFPEKSHETGYLLRILEAGLAAIFLVHIVFTILVVKENIAARRLGYRVNKSSPHRSFATRIMPVTGGILLLYLFLHLRDFVFKSHDGPASVVNGQQWGLYGLEWNAFHHPARVVFYVIAMFAVGFHLAHGIQSVVQTLGYRRASQVWVNRISTLIGIGFALAFSSIPVITFLSH